jgi:hypothetical protein
MRCSGLPPIDDPLDELGRVCAAVALSEIAKIEQNNVQIGRNGTITLTVGAMAVGAVERVKLRAIIADVYLRALRGDDSGRQQATGEQGGGD